MSEPVPQDEIKDAFRRKEVGNAFDIMYRNVRDHGAQVPWDDRHPAPLLVDWVHQVGLTGRGRPALIVGCGLGDDAEYVAGLGFEVTAFDVSPTAVELCQQRWPDSRVHYTVADVTNLPADWQQQFAFILESRTLQAMSWQNTAAAIPVIAACLAEAGDLLVLCMARDPEESRRGIPWPLSRVELQGFPAAGLTEVTFEDLNDEGRRFRVHYRRNETP